MKQSRSHQLSRPDQPTEKIRMFKQGVAPRHTRRRDVHEQNALQTIIVRPWCAFDAATTMNVITFRSNRDSAAFSICITRMRGIMYRLLLRRPVGTVNQQQLQLRNNVGSFCPCNFEECRFTLRAD